MFKGMFSFAKDRDSLKLSQITGTACFVVYVYVIIRVLCLVLEAKNIEISI
jgi:hypothetical protein